MKLIFLGPPGAGKGTLAVMTKDALKVPHVSTGEIFRTAIKNQTPLGVKVKGIIDSGGLVPDDLTIELVKNRLAEDDAVSGWILDGFPRTIAQADALGSFKAPDQVVNFDISNEAVVERLSGRRTCPACGNNHHVKFMPPKKEGFCDSCGGKLIVREDDKEESINKRLAVYRDQTEPLIAYYRGKGLLVDIDATGKPDAVFVRFKARFDI